MSDSDRPGASGPSAAAEWVPLEPPLGGAPLRALPDAAGAPSEARPLFHVLAEPTIARGADGGRPLFSLTLILARHPSWDDSSILPLVTGGVCGLTLTVLPSPDELEALAAGGAASYRALFPRRATWTLCRDGAPTPLARADEEGASGRGALSCTLTREDALAALAALRGDDTSLLVGSQVGFRALTAGMPALRVSVDLARGHDLLAARLGPDRLLDEAELMAALTAMLEADLVKVDGAPGAAAADLVTILRADLLRTMLPILGLAGEGPADGPPRRRLGPRPPDGTVMSFQRAAGPGAVERLASVARPLRDAMRGAVAAHGADAFVRLVCPGGGGELQPVSRRQPGARAGPPSADAGAPMASLGATTVAMPAVLKTGPTPASARALAASDLVLRPTAIRPHAAWQLDDLVLDATLLGPTRLRRLPVIAAGAALWPDRVDDRRFWYAPELVLVAPPPAATAEASPFLFSFRTVGHDAQGRPGLEATVRFTLRRQMSAAAQAAHEARGQPPAAPVPLGGLSASLEIPLRDEQGRARVEAVSATDLADDGQQVVATFQLTDNWARLCYGALAVPGFQPQPVRLVASYTFAAYVPVGDRDLRVAWGDKRALTEVAMPTVRDGPDGTRARPTVLTSAAVISPAAAHLAVAPQPAASLAVHAPLISNLSLLGVRPTTYGIRTQGSTTRLDVEMPCSQHGALYVQATDAGQTAIGCQDAFALGQIRLRLYEKVDVDLGTARPGLAVYRSLQVPGRFLVLPDAYTIARFEPGDDRAYRPAIYLFSNVDAEHPERSGCVLMATLQPGVPPFRRRQLLDALRRQHHPTPTLEWPTELASTPAYAWAIADAGSGAGRITPAAARTPDGFQVSLSTGIDGVGQLKAILERAGIGASVTFPLGDGTTLASTLAVDLTRIDGPWQAGAVEATRAGGAVTLVNRVEQPVDVGDLLLFSGGAQTGSQAVERRLASGESLAVEGVPAADEVVPRYTPAGGASSLDEVRTFIEDIYTNVVFLSSLDLAALRLTQVAVEARVVGVAGSATGTLSAATAVAELKFVLPLTVYLAQPTLQFRLSATGADGAVTTGPWQDWRLDTQGSVVSVTAALLQER